MPVPDLNLLRVFDVLFEERSVTRAAARLGLSQSAVSHALNRLRHMLHDELFIRSPPGMRPTARAAEIGPRVHASLGQLTAIPERARFDPAQSTRRFSLLSRTYTSSVLAPPLAKRVAALAPGLDLAFVDYGPDLLESLDRHEADVLIAAVTAALV